MTSYEPHGDIMYSHDIDKRITELKEVPDKCARDLEHWEEEELSDLGDFRDEVMDRYGTERWETGISFISGTYRSGYAVQMARDIYGAAVDTNAWNDEVWEDEYYEYYETFWLETEEYFTNGEG